MAIILKPRNLINYRNNNLQTRCGVAGAGLQTPSSLINSVSDSSYSSKSSKYHKSKTIRARELTFLECASYVAGWQLYCTREAPGLAKVQLQCVNNIIN